MKNFIAIDFETASAERASACSLALVKVADGAISEKHCWLFQPPENKYSPNNIRIHGITPDMTANLGNISMIHNTIMDLLSGSIVVAHNSNFDMDVLEKSLSYYGLPVPDIAELYCTEILSGGRRLEDCCAEYHIRYDPHDPLSDAVACAMLFMRLYRTVYRLRNSE